MTKIAKNVKISIDNSINLKNKNNFLKMIYESIIFFFTNSSLIQTLSL